MKLSKLFFSDISLLFVFIVFVRISDGAVNYKLTSFINDMHGNVSLWLGKRQASAVTYVDWCNNSIGWFYPLDMDPIWKQSSIPIITWKIAQCNHGDSGDPGIMKLVAAGSFDSYINYFADRLKQWLAGPDGIYGNDDDRRAYLRPGHEMNGNWYSWSSGSTPSDYIAGWHHTYELVTGRGLDPTRLQWIWSVNAPDVGQYKAEDYWVGDSYTHWLGIDGYNWGSSQSWSHWETPSDVFDDMISRLRKLSPSKPLSFNEYGTVSVRVGNTSDVQSKNEWLRQMCDYFNIHNVKMPSYFNVDEPHQDIMIFGGTYGDTVWNNFNTYSAYKNCLQSNDWIEPNITNPRLITDDQFAGRF